MKKTIFSYVLILMLIGSSMAAGAADSKRLIILHTNDTHSQLEPTSAQATKNPDMGGVVRRKAYIDEIRKKYGEENVLLVDAGDFCQGTPYFNFFGGEAEVTMMNLMGYDAATLGNHEFDNGVDALARLLSRADFPVVSSNYQVEGTPLAPYLKSSVILRKGDVKVGIIGVTVDPEGLIASKNYEGVRYTDPVEAVNREAERLKKEGADVVIVLSHLGYEYDDPRKPSDVRLAKASRNIDAIIGGHSHTLLPEPVRIETADGREILVGQTGKSGLYIGYMELDLKEIKK